MRERAATLALVGVAIAVCMLLAEAVLRVALDPVDFLKPEIVRGGVLPHVFRPGTGGHDDWGFRNEEVPEQVDLLAIGDSMTYGISAPREGSWPAQLGLLRRHSVYILALGGYGPVEYLHLLEQFGGRLSPREVVIGLFLGNDISDAADPRGADRAAREERPDTRPLGGLRTWLSQHSMLYQVTKAALPGVSVEARDRLAQIEAGAPRIELAVGKARTSFLPEVTFEHVDPQREPVRRGLARTLELLDALHGRCDELGARCLVALIPTKESVFAEVAATSLSEPENRRLRAVVEAEARLRNEVATHLARRGRRAVDLLPALRAAVADQRIVYSETLDMHPVASGYTVFAEAIGAALDAPRT